MTKKEVIANIAKKADMTQQNTAVFYEAFMDVIVDAMTDGELIPLQGVGKLESVVKKARVCKNPKTGATIRVPEKKSIKFKISETLKKSLNA